MVWHGVSLAPAADPFVFALADKDSPTAQWAASAAADAVGVVVVADAAGGGTAACAAVVHTASWEVGPDAAVRQGEDEDASCAVVDVDAAAPVA